MSVDYFVISYVVFGVVCNFCIIGMFVWFLWFFNCFYYVDFILWVWVYLDCDFVYFVLSDFREMVENILFVLMKFYFEFLKFVCLINFF